jgi:hypothetical protein
MMLSALWPMNVARALHSVMLERSGIAGSEVFPFLKIPECRRQTVRAVFVCAATSLPRRVPQSCSERLETHPSIDHTGVLPARERMHGVCDCLCTG